MPYDALDDLNFEIAHHEAALNDVQPEMRLVMESFQQQLKALDVLSQVYSDYKASRISGDQARYACFAVESAANLPSTSTTIAVEHIGNRIVEMLASIAHAVYETTKKAMDYIQYHYTLFNLQSSRAKRLASKLYGVSDGAVTVKVSCNKYLMYGEHKTKVASGDEYVKLFNEMIKVMVPFTKAVGGLAEDDLFSSLKFYKDYLFNDPEDFIVDQFNNMEHYTDMAKQGISGKIIDQDPNFVEYGTDAMLGLTRVVVRQPRKNLYKKSDPRTLITVHRNFYMYADRLTKVNLGSLVAGSLRLDFSKKQISQLIEGSQSLIEQANNLLKMSVRFSNDGAATGEHFLQNREKEDMQELWGTIQGMRFYSRTCSMIYDSVSSTYNYSLGSIKQGLEISERALKHMA